MDQIEGSETPEAGSGAVGARNRVKKLIVTATAVGALAGGMLATGALSAGAAVAQTATPTPAESAPAEDDQSDGRTRSREDCPDKEGDASNGEAA